MDLPRVDVRVTVTYPAPKGTFDGNVIPRACPLERARPVKWLTATYNCGDAR